MGTLQINTLKKYFNTKNDATDRVDIADVRIVAGEYVLNVPSADEQRLQAILIKINDDPAPGYNPDTLVNNIALVEVPRSFTNSRMTIFENIGVKQVARGFIFDSKVGYIGYNDLDTTINTFGIAGWGAIEVRDQFMLLDAV